MKTQITHKHPQRNCLHTPVLPNVPHRFRGLVSAAYASPGGAEYMKLEDWRDLELELN